MFAGIFIFRLFISYDCGEIDGDFPLITCETVLKGGV